MSDSINDAISAGINGPGDFLANILNNILIQGEEAPLRGRIISPKDWEELRSQLTWHDEEEV
jgi:hypothetical protein